MEPIAIIGMGCRFPGAKNVGEYWQVLSKGIDAVREVPASRWDVNEFYDPDPATVGKTNSRWGGFLENIDEFDPHFFGISPREAAQMDPQQRLLLEVGWEALEDAGMVIEQLAGSRTGVFTGITSMDYSTLSAKDFHLIDAYTAPGNAHSVSANRISYLLDLRGPSIALDTACSSSITALHLACSSLRNHECDLALAGGVNAILSPSGIIYFTKSGLTAQDGRCKTFSAQADGIARSEGAGIVVLKRLDEAQANGDHIYAVIRGSAVNHNGRTNGISAPSRWAQTALLEETYQRAGIIPGQVQYLEAHGTGTSLGDLMEAQALGAVLSKGRPSGSRCFIGSVKSNVGHLEAAAGVAGLIKVVLMLNHRQIPPSLHCETPNPKIPFDDLGLEVPQHLMPWPDDGPELAGVSAFGFGGANAHVIIEAYHPAESQPSRPLSPSYLLPISARAPEALRALVRAYQELLAHSPPETLGDLCYTASLRRDHHNYRLAVVGASPGEMNDRLADFLEDQPVRGLAAGRRIPSQPPRIVFVFSGQGTQQAQMGEELFRQEPVFRTVIEECSRLLQPLAGWSLLDELLAPAERSRIHETFVAQPALFAFQIALAALWRSWGIEPEAVIGHSLGEIAAAYVAGMLDLPDAIRLVYHRGQLMQKATGLGKMAAVRLNQAQARLALAGYDEYLSLAAENAPESTVISGETASLENLLGLLEVQGVQYRRLPVNYAFHSPQMEALQEELKQAVEEMQLKLHPATCAIYSTLTGQPARKGDFTPGYWAQQIRQPVRFAEAIGQLIAADYNVFLEIAPLPALSGPVAENLHAHQHEAQVLASIPKGETEYSGLLGSLAALYAQGCQLKWSVFYPAGGRPVHLPSYPWQRESCWLKVAEGQRHANRGGHPLLGTHSVLAQPAGAHLWENEISRQRLPYLEDHQIQGLVTVPAATHLEIAQAAAIEACGPGPHTLQEIEFQRAIFLPNEAARLTQVYLTPSGEKTLALQVFSRPVNSQATPAPWIRHVTGKIRPLSSGAQAQPPGDLPTLSTLRERCPQEIDIRPMYTQLWERGFEYGPCFQGMSQLWRGEGEAIGRIEIHPSLRGQLHSYHIHPAVLDASLQVLGGTVLAAEVEEGKGHAYMPTHVAELRIYKQPGPVVWSYARLRPGQQPSTDSVEGDAYLFDEDGSLVAEVYGFRVQRVDRQAARSAEDTGEWLHTLAWHPQEAAVPQEAAAPEGQPGLWLILSDRQGFGQGLAERLRLQGQECLLVTAGTTCHVDRGNGPSPVYTLRAGNAADFQELLTHALGTEVAHCRGIIHLWGVDTPASDSMTAAELAASQKSGCLTLLVLMQALARRKWGEPPRLWVITRGAQAVSDPSARLAVSQAPLWGFGRTLAQEFPALWGGLIDVDPQASPAECALQIGGELKEAAAENQVAFRAGQRYVARLLPHRSGETSERPVPWHPNGTYLITGGLGDLGLLTARWMVQQGARRLVLLGRTPLPPRPEWRLVQAGSRQAHQIAAIQELEALGASVHLGAVDVADEAQLRAFLDDFRAQGWPPIRGVMHAAATVQGQMLIAYDPAILEAVLQPKVVGGWLLHQLLADQPLDFFVSFSSISALIGVLAEGLGSYGAANAFLDALAHDRRAQGLPALSVNWGPWEQLGLAARANRTDRLSSRGVDSIPPQAGLEILGQLMAQGVTQMAVLPIRWKEWMDSYPTASQSPFFSELSVESAIPVTKAERSPDDLNRSDLMALPLAERHQRLEGYLRQQVARVLKLPVSKLDMAQPINSMGLDSLMAVELKNRIEGSLRIVIPIVNFFQDPTVSQLASQILEQLDTPSQPLPDTATSSSVDVNQLSDQEVDSLLAQLLAEGGPDANSSQ